MNKYVIDRNELLKTIEEIRSLPSLDRLEYIPLMKVMYPRMDAIIEDLKDCLLFRLVSEEPECYSLIGPTGAGKTTIIKYFLEIVRLELNTTEEIDETDDNDRFATPQIRVLYVNELPPLPTIRGFLKSILKAFGDPRFDKGSADAMFERIKEFCKDCGVEMIIFDEVNHFYRRNMAGNRNQTGGFVLQKVTDYLKFLIKNEEINVSCVFVGLEGEADIVVESNKQLGRLFPDHERLSPFEWNVKFPDTIKEYKKFISSIEDLLPLRKQTYISTDDDLAYRCFVASQGMIGYTMMLLQAATTFALKSGRESLEIDLLAKAFDKKLAGDRRDISNPFVGDRPKYSQPIVPPQPSRPGCNNRSQQRKDYDTPTANDLLHP